MHPSLVGSHISQPSYPGGLLEFKNLLLLLRRQWWRAFLIALFVALALGAAYLLFPFSFKSTASVMLDPRPQNVAPGDDVIAGFGTDPAAVESQAQYMISKEFLWEVIHRNGLESDPELTKKLRVTAQDSGWKDALVAALDKKIKVGRKGLTYLIDVTATDKNAERAAFFANAVADTYVAMQGSARQELAREARQWVNERLFVLNRKLRASETALASFKQEQGIIGAGGGNTTRERLLTDLTQQLSRAQAEAASASAALEALRKPQNPRLAVQNDDLQSATLTDLRSQYANLIRQHAEVATVYGERHPRYTAARLQIQSLDRQIENELGRLKSKQQSEFVQAQKKVALLEQRLSSLTADNTDFAQLAELEETAQADRKLYEQYLGRLKNLDQRESLNAQDVYVLSRAFPPARSSKPNIPIAAGGIGILALLSGIAFGLLYEGKQLGTVFSGRQLHDAGYKVLGVLPKLEHAPPDAGYISAVQHILPYLRGLQTLLITPMDPVRYTGEFVRYLADTSAKKGQNVILVSLHKTINDDKKLLGIADVLYKGLAVESSTQIRDSGAYYLPVGQLPDDEHYGRLLMDERLRFLIERLQNKYDQVYIEAPEPLILAGSSTLLEAADKVLLIAVWGESSLQSVCETVDVLSREEDRLVAIVLDDADPSRLSLYDPEAARVLKAGFR